jgi:TATA-binding protein-associated factor
MSFEKRAEIIAEFHAPQSPRVFIFSKIGSAGLNMSIADVVIFFVKSCHVPFSCFADTYLW